MYFSSATEVYGTLGKLVSDVVQSQGVGARLRQTDAIIQLSMLEPSARITVRCLANPTPGVAFGSTNLVSTVTLDASADTFHKVFLGTLNLWYAITMGRIRLGGGVERFAGVWPAVESVAPPRYNQLLELLGRADLRGDDES